MDYIGIDALLSLFASGRTTGLVCQSGYAVPILYLFMKGMLYRAINRYDCAGQNVTDYLVR